MDKAAPGDTVSVPANKAKHYVLTHGPIGLAESLTIRGAGAKPTIIDGGGSDGIFIEPGGSSLSPVKSTIRLPSPRWATDRWRSPAV